ncbi:MAG TPA: FG-GAP-like repeat-containing protein [Bryobacteraceae bacterium]|nr:FG-GAP-like repeat-containing protein [Bryobacteraceae bacterium]
MSGNSNSLFSIPSFIETGLVMMQSAMKTAQRTLDDLTGHNHDIKGAPVDGPADVDLAVADFANRLTRVARYSPMELSQLGTASGEVLSAAKASFRNLSMTDPRNVALPMQLALSFATLMTESALRGLVTLDVVGPARLPRLVSDFFEMFTETPVFAGLEYGELIDKCEKRLETHPEDYRVRLELARVLSKCGRYEDADIEFKKIPASASQYAVSRHEAGVALFRAGRYLQASHAEVDALNADSTDQRSRNVLFLSADKLGGYPAFVPEAFRMTIKAGFATPTVKFEDIAARIGLDKTSGGRGSAIFDYDNDGYLDILIGAAYGGTNLYHNNGDGTFTDVSIDSGLDISVNTFGTVAGDYDNDGFTDLYLTRQGFYVGEGQLFRNNGDGTFTDVTEAAGLKDVWGPAFTASWIDYDNDGFLDLFVANNLGGLFERKTPNRLFHNNGDGTFTDITGKAGIDTIWPTIGGAWGDYDNDGFMDLFLSNGLGRSQLFHNNGDGTFTDVSERAGVTAMGFGSPAFWWDYDNDGWMDIGQFIWSDHDDVIHTLRTGDGPPNGQPMRVYRNNRDGTFTQVNREIGLTGCWGTMSGSFGDFNNDGYMDLVLGNGSPKLDRLDPLVLLESDGRKFRNTTFAAGLPFTGKSHGANLGDLFGDGRLSVIVAAGGAYPGDLLTTSVYCPTTLPGNYLNVRLVGVKSNRSAIGARVVLSAGGQKQTREVTGGSNFGCMPLEQHFGLGTLDKMEALEVRWPSGLKQRFTGLPINKTCEFTEGSPDWKDVYGKKAHKDA